MTDTDSTASPEEIAVEQLTQKQIVESLISSKKKSSNKQEIAEFTKEWSGLANEEGVSDSTIGLLVDGFSIAGADPLFTLMDTDESCLVTLQKMEKLPKIEENPCGASLKIYIHLFALAVNAGRSLSCISSIISTIPKYAYNKEGKPFGTNPATISKYLLRELNASKASEILSGIDMQETAASRLFTIFTPAFEEAISKKKPVKTEIASVEALKNWLGPRAIASETATTVSTSLSNTLQSKELVDSNKTSSEKATSEPAVKAKEFDTSMSSAKAKVDEPPTYDSVIAAIRNLERAHMIVESKLSSAENTLRAKEETIDKLKASLDDANSHISTLKEANCEKQRQIDNANLQIEKLQHEIEKARSTADDRAEMIAMLDKNREQKGSEALARIASKLKADYGDFKEYEGEAMTIELGEIVKLQLGQVFETLKSAGVKL